VAYTAIDAVGAFFSPFPERPHACDGCSKAPVFHPHHPLNGRFDHGGEHRGTGLLQCGCALPAHIQFIADQETLVAHKSLADGAVIHILCGAADGGLPGGAELLLVERIVNDLLALGGWNGVCFGKPLGFIAVLRATTGAPYAEEKHFLCRQVFQYGFHQCFQYAALLSLFDGIILLYFIKK
jgi:hypothetical protein